MLSCEVKSQLDFRIASMDAQRDLRQEMRERVRGAMTMRNARVMREYLATCAATHPADPLPPALSAPPFPGVLLSTNLTLRYTGYSQRLT